MRLRKRKKEGMEERVDCVRMRYGKNVNKKTQRIRHFESEVWQERERKCASDRIKEIERDSV